MLQIQTKVINQNKFVHKMAQNSGTQKESLLIHFLNALKLNLER